MIENTTTATPRPAEETGDHATAAPRARVMSFAQERLWIVDQLVDDKALYNTSMRFALDGELDVDAFHRALDAVVQRHAVLRTGFDAAGACTLAHDARVDRIGEDLRAHADPDAAARERQRERASLPFDLQRPPLLRSSLYRVADDRHEWLLTVHHIVFDGASIDVLLQELGTLYEGGALPPLAHQMSDIAAAERERLSGEHRRRLLDGWKQRLGGELPVLALPGDRPRPATQSFRGATLRCLIDDDLRVALDAACRRERVTPFMLVFTAYAIWLCRHTGQPDVVIGSPFALRGDAASQGVIGFFVNTVALRLAVDGSMSFRQLLRSARDLCLQSYAAGELPFADVVGALEAGRDLGHAPVFQAMLTVQSRRASVALSPALRMRYLGELPIDKARFDVAMVLDFLEHGAELSLEYSRDLFDPPTAQRLLDRFLVLLASALADPEQPAGRLALLPAGESAQLHEWASLPVASVPDDTVHALFERVAAAQPDAIAVRHSDVALSFRELDEQADRLAGWLHADGVRPSDLVGVCLPRTPGFLVAVLALWKAGAAYVPLDPEQPAARHAYIANDAGVRCVLTNAAYRGRFVAEGRRVASLDDADLQRRIAACATRAPLARDAAALAYAIYTSGSTGEPKGVLVEHRAVSRLLGSPRDLGYDRDTVMLQSINVAFDASVLETWAPLCCGGQLVLHPGQSLDLPALPALIAQHGIDTLTLPASVLDLWVEQLRGPCGLARIVVGGEALSPATLARLYALDPHVRVINHYGPTENGILSTYWPIPRDFAAPVPIGLPAPGTQAFVLDDRQQLLPAGVVGELYLAGQGVARGYLGRAALTAEKFLPAGHDAHSTHWYRTGDLVRWQATDMAGRAILQFVGRVDQQVKIRGFRIELGEIEAQLRACAGIQDARAVVHPSASGDRRIVAYVIAPDAQAGHGWRAQLQERLPAYMIPAAFVVVPAWPLTQNGKVDLKALPAPDRDAYARQSFAPARTPTEHRLLELWCDLLDLDRIGIDDNFFEIGGHSLLATRLHNRLRAAFAVELPLRAIFDTQTVRRLAARLDAATPGRAHARPPVAAMPPADHAPLSYAQQRLWFIHHLDPDSAQYHIPHRLRLRGQLDAVALHGALQALVDRHAVLRTTFREIAGEPRQVTHSPLAFSLPLHDVSALAEPARMRDAERHLLAESQRPFDLGRDPSLRACLIRLDDDEHWLALTAHHIAADGWSIGILERELAALYADAVQGHASVLPTPAVQYADYAQWQRQWLDEASLAPQFAYWQQRLQGLPLLHGLPLDRPRPAVQSARGDVVRQSLPQELVAGLRTLAQSHDATLFMGLHAAFAILLSRWSGETDIVVGTPVANRRDEALAPLVGLFINTLVFRSDLSADPTFLALLAQARDDALDAYEHQDLPFELLVERLNPPRHAAYGPLFQILFALQNHEASSLALPGLDVSPLPLTERHAKFDLALNLQPAGDALLAEWEFSTDLFDRATIMQMAACYETLLRGILAAPGQRASRLPLLDAASRAHVLALGNDTDRAYDERDCLHTLIARQAARTPDAVAVMHGDATLSYAQLDRDADRLARHLRGLGVSTDVPVAVAMERDPRLVVGLLAVLKAGGCYVPLDVGYPEARLAVMLDDCRPAVVLTLGEARERIEAALAIAGSPSHVLDLGTGDWRAGTGTVVAGDTPSSAVAYVIYTSGSTGRPKGVMNEHRAIVNRLRWMQEAYPLSARDRFLQTAAIGFGASVFEIFWPLLAGAPLVLTEGDGHKDPAYLAALIQRHGVTTLHFVPSMLQAFLDHPQARGCTSLERVFCGGEPLSGHLARRCREQLPDAHLYHLYGSSETAVLSTGWDCSPGPIPDNVPIGTPGANTRLYLLDAHGEPVPHGVRGEIHVAGRQVARGYLGHDALNAERFVAAPCAREPGARMYRTGDLGRQLADGSIEHLGRNDFQIKIRGQRVEPGDIEAQLLAHADVHQAVVIAHGDGAELKLVAYLVPSPGAPSGRALVDGLRTWLSSQLPAHMVPGAWIALSQFPLNANGKLDRQALPSPDDAAPTTDVVPPENDLQCELLALWHELLKEPHLGITCDFFAAGGHSLLALRLANRLRESFAYELDLKTFFADPTVRALADDIHRRRQARLAVRRFHDSDASDVIEL